MLRPNDSSLCFALAAAVGVSGDEGCEAVFVAAPAAAADVVAYAGVYVGAVVDEGKPGRFIVTGTGGGRPAEAEAEMDVEGVCVAECVPAVDVAERVATVGVVTGDPEGVAPGGSTHAGRVTGTTTTPGAALEPSSNSSGCGWCGGVGGRFLLRSMRGTGGTIVAVVVVLVGGAVPASLASVAAMAAAAAAACSSAGVSGMLSGGATAPPTATPRTCGSGIALTAGYVGRVGVCSSSVTVVGGDSSSGTSVKAGSFPAPANGLSYARLVSAARGESTASLPWLPPRKCARRGAGELVSTAETTSHQPLSDVVALSGVAADVALGGCSMKSLSSVLIPYEGIAVDTRLSPGGGFARPLRPGIGGMDGACVPEVAAAPVAPVVLERLREIDDDDAPRRCPPVLERSRDCGGIGGRGGDVATVCEGGCCGTKWLYDRPSESGADADAEADAIAVAANTAGACARRCRSLLRSESEVG
jgi:hypothetical protein